MSQVKTNRVTGNHVFMFVCVGESVAWYPAEVQMLSKGQKKGSSTWDNTCISLDHKYLCLFKLNHRTSLNLYRVWASSRLEKKTVRQQYLCLVSGGYAPTYCYFHIGI